MIVRQRQDGVLRPWFRQRPRLAVGVAALLAVATWGVGFVLPWDRAALVVVLALPIALSAVSFGAKGGAIAGAGAVVVLAGWVIADGNAGVSVSGWASGAATVALGALLGEAVDGLAASERRARRDDDARRRLEHVASRRREAVEINDRLVQSAAVAKWALEAGDVERALEVLQETVDAGQRLVTALINDDGANSSSAEPSSRSVRVK